jgi:uncharacterized membrane protein YfcA
MAEAILLASAGALAGLLAGMLGIGGGVILVPALIFLFESKKVPPEVVTQLAVGTSLASIIFTGSAGSWIHHRNRNIDWPIVWAMAPFILISTQIGSLLAVMMHGQTLKRLFGFFEFFVAARMLKPMKQEGAVISPSPLLIYILGGILIGTLSSLFGIGGGTLSVPILVYLLGRPLKMAIGTSSAQGVVIAIFGTAGFIYQGGGVASLPEGTFGYVDLKAALLITLTSLFTAPFGALLVPRISAAVLSRIFGILLIFVGLKLLGFF